jgi:aminopeptidase N
MGGGMESPMMANNGDASDPASAAATVFHEIAHTYFPFFMGTNERKYAWMDEGWAANLPIGFMNEYFPERNYLERFVGSFENINGKEREMTLMTLSNAIGSYDAYRVHAYVRPALAYYFLQDALGDSLFKVALITYIERWNGKHPIPIDFFNTFSAVINQYLSWFFQPWFYEKAVADQAIKKVTLDNKIVVENTGGLPLPIVINLTYEDGSTELVEETTAVWFAGEKAVVIQANPELRLRKVTLGSELIPDVNRENNSMLLKYN